MERGATVGCSPVLEVDVRKETYRYVEIPYRRKSRRIVSVDLIASAVMPSRIDPASSLLCSAADTSPWRGLALRIQLKGRASLMESNPARCRQRGGGGGVLPLDVLFDVLVRLPAKEICRFRAVCRHWRSLTSDPLFIEAHAARHPGPLIVASFDGDDEGVHLMDLSGRVVKRLPVASGRRTCLCSSRLDLVGVMRLSGLCSVVNPATGAVLDLPDTPPDDDSPDGEELESWSDSEWPEGPEDEVFALGRVDSTGEYKVLRISNMERWRGFQSYDEYSSRAYSVLTVNGSGRNRWRHADRPECPVDMDSAVVAGGSVYCFWKDEYQSTEDLNIITAFDLQTEEWTIIKGPQPMDDEGISSDEGSSDDEEDSESDDGMWSRSTLTELNGYLVLVHECGHESWFFDLWFLIDTQNHVWAKQHSIQSPELVIPDDEMMKPLLFLDDGRIVIFLCDKGVLLLYDPKANVFSEVDTRRLDAVGLYTGSLLSLQSVANV
ncbi:hypothetical protein EJB05_57541, partial [Eragrostis curvula]